ncbi:MAG TPA: FAD-dependent oxidoreductase [Gammaproteobacteria bacterium]|nr:FAD-dependent oxidoreductase [Gammaproteobacteria bacterium]
MTPNSAFDYIVVGGGPAGLCAIAKLIALNIPPKKIAWIDPHFEAGDFGTCLSAGSGVPGNTTVESYLRVISAMNCILEAQGLAPVLNTNIHHLNPNTTCTLNEASKPFKTLTHQFQRLVCAIKENVTAIHETPNKVSVLIDKTTITANHVILATGASPKNMNPSMPLKKIIDCNIAFIASELKKFLSDSINTTSVAVVGSSHSAALAVMQLLKLNCEVHHFMVGEYRYAESKITPEGEAYTKFDNTGLKGEVARFTKDLNNKQYHRYSAQNKAQITTLLNQHESKFTHLVVAIGYETSNTLTINHHPLSTYAYNPRNLKLNGLSHITGLGIAFPPKIIGHEGETEYAVGVGKFWATVNDPNVMEAWQCEALPA